MSDSSTDRIKTFYTDRHVFFTGASGLLGTASVTRLVTDTPVARVYALVRGGERRLYAIWRHHLPAALVDSIKASGRLVVWDGDITHENCGLDASKLDQIRENVSIFIHAASTINLRQPLARIAKHIIDPSMAIGKMALECGKLERFMYVSSSFAGTFLRPNREGGLDGSDAFIEEDIIQIRNSSALHSAETELADLRQFGTTPEYEFAKYPYPYSYAKHLTERLLLKMFQDSLVEEKLTILRPTVIGPAESLPAPGFEIAGSCPVTSVVAATIVQYPWNFEFPSHLSDPSQSTADEVPVDMAANRLIVHAALGTTGCVHATAGVDNLHNVMEIFRESAKFRRFWWRRPVPIWTKVHWGSKSLSLMAQIAIVFGGAFRFADSKSEEVWKNMSREERECWPLWRQKNMPLPEDLARRHKAVSELVARFLGKAHNIPSSLRFLIYRPSL